jgi:RNA polymerase sigma-70 factor (ECF subfamily)
MDLEEQVERARRGDLAAFVALTRRFQQFAFGLALALVRDFPQAEDVVQETFVAAWTALPSLAEPAAFPGWLRGIVRHHAFRALRRRPPAAEPLAAAADVAHEAPTPEDRLAHRQRAAAALAALAALPATLREPAILFYLHDCSQQDVATFLGLTVATVNNRLHAARTKLKERMLTMATDALHAQRLPDDFAQRIGRLIESRDRVVDSLFDPSAPPDLLTELILSDAPNGRAIKVQVVQRLGGGMVRGVADGPIDPLPRGSTVLSSSKHSLAPVGATEFAGLVPMLAGPAPALARPLETGIKVIDALCPLVAGGTLAIAGDLGAGITVVMEELTRRLRDSADPLTIFILMPQPSAEWPGSLAPDFSHTAELAKEGYSEGTVGAVQTFFLRAEDGPWTDARLAALAPADTVLRLSRDQARARIYPTVDPLASRSRLLDSGAAPAEHAAVAQRVRDALTALRADAGDPTTLMRARKLAAYFGQPFFCAEPYTGRPGVTVGLAQTLADCRAILDGAHDDLPLAAFVFTGAIAPTQPPLPPPWHQA